VTEIEVVDVVAVLRTELAAGESVDEFDITVNDETGAIECATDDWTLLIEGVPETPAAWIAIDEEPENEAEFERAQRDTMNPAEVQALIRADAALGGLLSQALDASGDPFSQHVARALVEGRGQRVEG
jgi:hypothetical protein